MFEATELVGLRPGQRYLFVDREGGHATYLPQTATREEVRQAVVSASDAIVGLHIDSSNNGQAPATLRATQRAIGHNQEAADKLSGERFRVRKVGEFDYGSFIGLFGTEERPKNPYSKRALKV